MTDLIQMQYFLPLCASFFTVFLLREYVSFRKKLYLKYILTPLVTFSVVLFVLLSVRMFGLGRYNALVLLGLVISMTADTLLMIEERSYFLQGLIFFLFTHGFYMGAFTIGYDFRCWHLAVAAALGVLTVVIFLRIFRAHTARSIWVLLYTATLSGMCYFAWSHLGRSASLKSVLLPAGAALFVISDAILGINTFVKRIPHSTVLTWSLYAPAQLLIALSCFF
jgi:uncharacterized membrane protein YhhN